MVKPNTDVEKNLRLINLESGMRIIITLSALAESDMNEDTVRRIMKEIGHTAKAAMSE